MYRITSAYLSLLKVLAISVLVFGASHVMAQPKMEVPTALSAALIKQYPAAEAVTWKPKAKQTWLAKFKIDEHSYTSRYTQTGLWLETEKSIKASELPEPIRLSVARMHDGWDIQRARFMSNPAESYYLVFIENDDDDTKSLRFDEEGNPLKKE